MELVIGPNSKCGQCSPRREHTVSAPWANRRPPCSGQSEVRGRCRCGYCSPGNRLRGGRCFVFCTPDGATANPARQLRCDWILQCRGAGTVSPIFRQKDPPAHVRLTAARMRKITSTQGERHFEVDMRAVPDVRIRRLLRLHCSGSGDQSDRHACPSHTGRQQNSRGTRPGPRWHWLSGAHSKRHGYVCTKSILSTVA
jgi:hypothetical protein